MKITEIIEPQEVEKKSYRDFNPDISRQTQASIELDRDNYGRYAKGTPDRKDPLTFRKTPHQPSKLEQDAYYQYVKAAAPLMKSNPYFPRVYKITVNKDSLGQTKPSYNLETLHPNIVNPQGDQQQIAHEQQVQALEAVMDRMFVEVPKLQTGKSGLGRYLETIAQEQDYSNVKDPKLVQALELINSVAEKGSFNWDLHAGNIAFRLTSFGPQLVLMDPLS